MPGLKGSISKYGELRIERKGQEVLQNCPHGKKACNHFCPLFSEPDSTGDYTTIDICNGKVLRFVRSEFKDQRA